MRMPALKTIFVASLAFVLQACETPPPDGSQWRHSESSYAADFSANGQFLLTASTKAAARLWDLQNNRIKYRLLHTFFMGFRNKKHQFVHRSPPLPAPGNTITTDCQHTVVVIGKLHRLNNNAGAELILSRHFPALLFLTIR